GVSGRCAFSGWRGRIGEALTVSSTTAMILSNRMTTLTYERRLGPASRGTPVPRWVLLWCGHTSPQSPSPLQFTARDSSISTRWHPDGTAGGPRFAAGRAAARFLAARLAGDGRHRRSGNAPGT